MGSTDDARPRWGRRAITALGAGISLLALGWVVALAWESRAELAAWQPSQASLIAVAAGSVAYGAAMWLISYGWWRLLLWCGASRSISFLTAHVGYARTSIAKYLPLNVFHFAGRHILGRRAGIGHDVLVIAAGHEVLGVVAASSAIGLAAHLLTRAPANSTIGVLTAVACLVAALGLPILFSFLRRTVPALGRLRMPVHGGREALRELVPVVGGYMVFFFATGLVLLGLVGSVVGMPDLDTAATIVAWYAIAWLAGYLTPGAPAGIGPREAVLVSLLSGTFTEANAVLVATLFRVTTTLGEVVYFSSSLPFRLPDASPEGKDASG